MQRSQTWPITTLTCRHCAAGSHQLTISTSLLALFLLSFFHQWLLLFCFLSFWTWCPKKGRETEFFHSQVGRKKIKISTHSSLSQFLRSRYTWANSGVLFIDKTNSWTKIKSAWLCGLCLPHLVFFFLPPCHFQSLFSWAWTRSWKTTPGVTSLVDRILDKLYRYSKPYEVGMANMSQV